MENLCIDIRKNNNEFIVKDDWKGQYNYKYNIPASIVDEISKQTNGLENEKILESLFIILNGYESCLEQARIDCDEENNINHYLNDNEENLIKNISTLINKYGYDQVFAHLKQANTENILKLFEDLEKEDILNIYAEENEYNYEYNEIEDSHDLNYIPNEASFFIENPKIKTKNYF